MSAKERYRSIFLHSGWRTAGTWIWSQFRRHGRVMGFYEPLSESLATLTLQSMRAMRPGATNSRHPEPNRPYFEEFAPLFGGRRPGVAGYRPEFAYESFFLDAESDAPHLAAYLDSLLSLAHGQAKLPVLKFCRSSGRVAWLRKQFPDAAHVVVLRDPVSQWLSGWKIFLEDGNPYYITTPLRTLVRHKDRDTVAKAIELLRVRPRDYDFPHRHAACCRFVKSMTPEALYRGFLAFWVSTTTAALPEADVVIESERLSDPEYRVVAEQSIESLTGITISLADARPLARTISANSPFEMERAHRDALESLTAMGAPQMLHDKLAPAPAFPVSAYA